MLNQFICLKLLIEEAGLKFQMNFFFFCKAGKTISSHVGSERVGELHNQILLEKKCFEVMFNLGCNPMYTYLGVNLIGVSSEYTYIG